ncbi:hypothetical protein AVEN_202821-1 [Araneus ventricosus]|uniref:Uncharacterized protein n=1 Tax=Araneus ventricosus TaxID=182803 RepID=A0A4Y2DNQ4_ARAVE|nr:hypothetical protein AVEN_202821-1 [Araneus ventricosus]
MRTCKHHKRYFDNSEYKNVNCGQSSSDGKYLAGDRTKFDTQFLQRTDVMHFKFDFEDQIFSTTGVVEKLAERLPVQASSSSSDHGSNLRGQFQNRLLFNTEIN